MQIPAVKAEKRTASGTKAMRKLRAAGFVPGVLYGKGQQNENFQMSTRDLTALIHDAAHVVELDIDGAKTTALVRALDRDHLADTLNHIDLVRVGLNDRVRSRVPIVLIGTPKGTAHGGVLEVLRGEVEVNSEARSIPRKIEIEVAALEIGDAVRYKDLKLPEGVEGALRPETVIVHCAQARRAVTEEATPGAPGAAPAAGAAAPAAGAKGAPAAGAKAAPAAAGKAGPAKK